MSIKGAAYIAGIYEHPLRKADNKSLAQLHAEVAKGALEDAGLTKNDVDAYFCAGDVAGWEARGTGDRLSATRAATRASRAAEAGCCAMLGKEGLLWQGGRAFDGLPGGWRRCGAG